MRIAQVAPLFERVPPVAYGGTERVVAYLTDALVELGHDVTLFASGDSQTRARLVSAVPRSLRLDPSCRDYAGASHPGARARRRAWRIDSTSFTSTPGSCTCRWRGVWPRPR